VQTTPRSPVGVEVTGLDLARETERSGARPVCRLDDEQVDRLRTLLAEHGVLVVPGQDALDDDGFAAFLRRFGELTFTVGETPVPGRDDLNVVSNVGRATPPRSVFHVDTSYVARPPAYTALRAVAIPARGGETLFTNQYCAHDTLPADIRMHLAGRTVTHVVSGLRPEDAGPETSAEHPLFRRHRSPGGRRSTFRRPSAAWRSAGWTAARRDRRSATSTSTRRPRTTRCATPGRPATSSCGTTAASCTVPTTATSAATG
jgi:alpha-ketoglutarate-dependent taurine dioxygenase